MDKRRESKKGQGFISQEKFKAYVGIEIAMSIIKLNDISDYWSKKRFLGNKDISDVMSLNDFKTIRGI